MSLSSRKQLILQVNLKFLKEHWLMELKFVTGGFFWVGELKRSLWSVMIEYGLQVSQNVSKEKSGTVVKLLSIQIE